MSSNYSFGRTSAVYKKKKNFTFVKLLAVFVVFAVIANIVAMKKRNDGMVELDISKLIVKK